MLYYAPMITLAALLVAQAAPARQEPVRKPITPELLASAYEDSASRALVLKGRAARVRQDSSIAGYDAKVAQRLSVKAAVGAVTMERLAYRQENTARVQWQRGVGAHVEVTGARVTMPPVGMPSAERGATEGLAADPSLIPLPYFPGQEPLWVGQFKARPDVNERSMLNPLANGAEAYYRYSSGAAATIRLANGDSIVVRQVDVRPRTATPNALVGSLWLDDATGQVVRAAYRMAAPGAGSVSVTGSDSAGKGSKVTLAVVRAMMKAMMPTMTAEVTDIVVEYQLVRGFWLPRSQVMNGYVKASFARVPVTMENSFRFESVNETSGLGAFTVDSSARRGGTGNTVKAGSLEQCRTSSKRVVTAYKADSIPVRIEIPCNVDSLMHSPDLPASAFDEGEEIFGTAQRDDLAAQALSLADQGPLRLLRWAPYLNYGVSYTRYNRIEGFSPGFAVGQSLGGGLDVRLIGRIGTADHVPRFEGSLGLSNSRSGIRVGGYDRLVAMTDWEAPLTFGSSLSAFFFGRDDAFYYRAGGVEITGNADNASGFTWRGFHERHRQATARDVFSVSGTFLPNIGITPGNFYGLELRHRSSHGLDPRGFRIATDVRLESAVHNTIDTSYARGMAELTMTKGFAAALDGALTLSAGTSSGGLPIQRRWYLGGTQTIRGQYPGETGGESYWMTRGEVARPLGFMRLALFGDLGWTGRRNRFADVIRPLSGAGVGFSFLDGAARLDVARGIFPLEKTRVFFYLGSRF